jgi:hypothetical protein
VVSLGDAIDQLAAGRITAAVKTLVDQRNFVSLGAVIENAGVCHGLPNVDKRQEAHSVEHHDRRRCIDAVLDMRVVLRTAPVILRLWCWPMHAAYSLKTLAGVDLFADELASGRARAAPKPQWRFLPPHPLRSGGHPNI